MKMKLRLNSTVSLGLFYVSPPKNFGAGDLGLSWVIKYYLRPIYLI